MAETFYSVLGVQPDADRETLERAYRKRVKESHPDVTDNPDAPRAFARLTVARDVLVDDEERGHYDRLGHAAYVRAHVDASVWTVDSGETDTDPDETAPDETAPDETAPDETAPDETAPGNTDAATGRTDTTTGADTAATSTENRTEPQGGEGTAAGERRQTAASEQPAAADRSDGTGVSGAARTATGGRRRRQHRRGTAAAYHRVDPTDIASGERDPLWRRVAAVGRRVGPWALVHLVLVTSAAATAWFGYAGAAHLDMSLPALAVAVVVLVTTVFASAAHLLAQVYA